MLPDDKRSQLDSIVKQMIANKESDANIQAVVNDFKSKYSTDTSTLTPSKPGLLDRVLQSPISNAVKSIFPGKRIGESIGTLAGYVASPNKSTYDLSAPTPLQTTADAANAALTIAGIKLPVAPTVLGKVGQYAALSGGSALASGVADAKPVDQIVKETGTAAAIGGVTGGVFGLLGKGITATADKTASPVLSFTSGVPKEAIDQAIANPEAVKQGIPMSLNEIRDKAAGSLRTLYSDLGNEFSSGLDEITSATGQTKSGMTYNQSGFLKSAQSIQSNLTEYARQFAREFRLATKMTPEGVEIGFSKSPITKPGEMRAVQEAFSTISTWDDFSAKGMQDLAERIGSLRNFENGAKTESSAIISKIYNKIAGTGGVQGIIPKYYPELATLRTNFATSKKALDEIQSILASDAKDPKAIQGSISRLDTIFKENKQLYLNIIKNLVERSGVDFLSLLAGNEFQKVLPSFVRGLGGAGVVGVGAALLNPYLALLAPLFSPRAVGEIVTNAPKIVKTASTVVRSVATQSASRAASLLNQK